MSEDRSYKIAKNPPTLPKDPKPTRVTPPVTIPPVTPPPTINVPPFVWGAGAILGITEGIFTRPFEKDPKINPITIKPYKNDKEQQQVEVVVNNLNYQQKQAITTLPWAQREVLSNATNIRKDNKTNCITAEVPNAGKTPANRAVIEAISGKNTNPSIFVMTPKGQTTIFDVGNSRTVGMVNTSQSNIASGFNIPQLKVQRNIASTCKFNFTAYSTNPTVVTTTQAAGFQSKYQPMGGPYNTVRQKTKGGEVHHTPADSVVNKYPISRVFAKWPDPDRRINDIAPTVWMTENDHRKTKSWGGGKESRAYRAKQDALIKSGDFRGAIQMDIDDIHNNFGYKYDPGIKQMLDYVNKLEQAGTIPKSRVRTNILRSEVPSNAENSTAQNTNQAPVATATNPTIQESSQTDLQATSSMGETTKVAEVNNIELQEILARMQVRNPSTNILATTSEINQNLSPTTQSNTTTSQNDSTPSSTAFTNESNFISSALTGSTAFTGTVAGRSPTALTGGTTPLTGGTTPLTGGTTPLTGGTTPLTGGETQKPSQLQQGLALS
jgi:hypothetical protein